MRPACAIRSLLLLSLWLVTGLAIADPQATLERLTKASGQSQPVIRIGLAHAHAITVSASGSFRLVDLDRGEPLWRKSFKGRVRVVADGGPTEEVPSVYRVQVGASGMKARRARN